MDRMTAHNTAGGQGPDSGLIADVVETRVFVDHEVTFLLASAERFVVPRRHVKNGYAQVDGITVHFHSGGRIRVFAGGIVCKKDGTFSEHWGRANVTVDLPDEAPWIERARVQLIDGEADG